MNYVEELRALVGPRPLILVGSVVFLLDATGRILLQSRPNGIWGLPGGLMELGESVEDTARREVEEETGLQVRDLQMVGLFSGPEFYIKLQNEDEFYSVTAAFATTCYSGEMQADGEETLDLRYFAPSEIPATLAKRHRLMLDRFLADQYEQFVR
jgi:8-oxo-dGTP pyrophosphatase MutT (NUDIX family)